jgi:phosphomannomutase
MRWGFLLRLIKEKIKEIVMLFLEKIKGTLAARTVAIALIVSFSLYNVGFALPEAKIAPPDIASETGPLSADDISVAIDSGSIRSKYDGNSGKLIVHIQDAHCNFEAQSNISSILEQLSQESGIDMISVEGAEGKVDTAWFRAFPDAEIRREVATYFMKKGEITGAEYFSINSDYNGTIFGAETRDYYVQNLNAFMDVYPYKDMIEEYFKGLRSVGTRLKALIYPPRLRELDSKMQAFNGREKELSEFAAYLDGACSANGIKTDNYPDFKRLTDTLEYEKKIDFDIVDDERGRYIDALSKQLSKEEMAELVAASVRFKKGHIKAVDFYSYLRDLAREHNIAIIHEYPNLFYYYLYTRIYDGINVENLFREIDDIGRTLKAELIKDDLQRDLDRYSEKVDMLVKLTNIELTNECYDRYKEYSSSFSLEDVLAFYSTLVSRYNLDYSIGTLPDEIRQNLPQMIAFYEIAIKRDKALIDNTIRQMEAEGKDRSVLIAGGFHTRGITDILESKGISYVVVTPKITKDVDSPYIQVLTNQRTSIEDIITDSAAMPAAAARRGHLSPLMRFGWGITTYLNPKDRQALVELSGTMGNIEGGRDFYGATVASFDEAVRLLTGKWLESIRQKMETDLGMSPAEADVEFNKFLNNEDLWEMLTAVYLSKYDDYFASLGRTPNQEVRERIKTAFQTFRSGDRPAPTPGVQAAGPRVLEGAEADRFDAVLRASFEAGTWTEEPIGKTMGRPEFKFIVHDGLIEALANEGLPANVHPGRGGAALQHKGLQAHIDRFVLENLSSEEFLIVARHELAHLDIFNENKGSEAYVKWVEAGSPMGQSQEDFVNNVLGYDVRDIAAKIEMLVGMLTPEDMTPEEKALREDISYGDAARKEIYRAREEIVTMRLKGGEENQALADEKEQQLNKWIKGVYTRRANIDHMQGVLTSETYNGYDVIIISSSTQDEADYQQKVLEKTFEGRRTGNDAMGNKVVILSVLDEAEGGQIIGQANTWRRAVDQFAEWASANGLENTNLDELFGQDKVKVAVYHNGGKGERASPATQSLGNSRGAQKLVGKVTNPQGEEVDLELITAVVLETAPLAMSNDRSRVDTFWANQVAFGTTDFANLERSNFQFDKFVIKVPKNPKKKDLFDYGTAVIDEVGKIVKFLANKVLTKKDPATGKFVDNPDFARENEELLSAPKGVFDYGSFSMSRAMHYAIMDYWTNVQGIFAVIDDEAGDGKAGISRDIDPALVQVVVPLVNGLSGKEIPVAALPPKEELRNMPASLEKDEVLKKAYEALIGEMDDQEFIDALNKIYNNPKKKQFVLEAVEFFILYQAELFGDLDKVIGHIDMGEESHWFAYKRILDLSNEKFFMLADILGYSQEIEPDGEVTTREATLEDIIKAEDSRRVRNIKDEAVAVFYTENGEKITLSAEDVRKGYYDRENDIEIKGSVIQGKTVLLPGSRIINSVVNDSQGVIVAENSYVESATSPEIKAENAIIYKAIDEKSVSAVKGLVADAYRPELEDARFRPGQTRMRASIGYDPKGEAENDKVRFGDNAYSFQEVRDLPVNRSENDAIEARNRQQAFFEAVGRQKAEMIERRIRIVLRDDAEPLKFGTSGLRDTVDRYEAGEFLRGKMTDREVYINTRGFISFLREMGDINNTQRTIAVGGDLRSSTSKIQAAVIKAIQDEGLVADYIGDVPSPVLAYYAMQKGMPSVMVTGSHIPEDRNGIKYTKISGEVLKSDEEPILANVKKAREEVYGLEDADYIFDSNKNFLTEQVLPESVSRDEAVKMFIDRYVNGLPADFLKGRRVVIYQHSAVGRDINAEIFKLLGAEVIIPTEAVNITYVDEATRQDKTEEVYLRSETFVPVDTEKITNKTQAVLDYLRDNYPADAYISFDGDTDRPLFADENAKFLPGDKLGALSAQFLKADMAAIPVTSNRKMVDDDLYGKGMKVLKTRVGSPYVIDAVQGYLAENPDTAAVTWEANGGFLLMTPVQIEGAEAELKALPTRDATLPLVLAVHQIGETETGKASDMIRARLTPYETNAGVVDNKSSGAETYTAETGQTIKKMFQPGDENVAEVIFGEDGIYMIRTIAPGVPVMDMDADRVKMSGKEAREILAIKQNVEKYFTAGLGFKTPIAAINFLDGPQLVFDDGTTYECSQLRPSSNAPEFRNYALAKDIEKAKEIANRRYKIVPQIIADLSSSGKRAEVSMTPGKYSVTLPEKSGAGEALRVPLINGRGILSSDTINRREVLRMPFVNGGPILATGERDMESALVLTEDEEGNIEAHDRIEIFKYSPVSVPHLLEGRAIQVEVTEGEVSIGVDGGYEASIPANMMYQTPEGAQDVMLWRSSDERAVASIRYTNTPGEQAAYQTLYMVQKHLAEIKKQKIRLYMPEELFFKRGGRHDVGSLAWTQNIMKRLVGDNVDIRVYQTSGDSRLLHLANMTLEDGFQNVLVAAQGHLSAADQLRNEQIKDFIVGAKILPIPDDALKFETGWDFCLETVGWGLILGAVTPDQIRDAQNEDDPTSPAVDMHNFIKNVLKRDIDVEYLYMMMPYKTRLENIANITDQEVKEALESKIDIVQWMNFLVKQILFSMPIRALDPTDALRQRMKVLWSA